MTWSFTVVKPLPAHTTYGSANCDCLNSAWPSQPLLSYLNSQITFWKPQPQLLPMTAWTLPAHTIHGSTISLSQTSAAYPCKIYAYPSILYHSYNLTFDWTPPQQWSYQLLGSKLPKHNTQPSHNTLYDHCLQTQFMLHILMNPLHTTYTTHYSQISGCTWQSWLYNLL